MTQQVVRAKVVLPVLPANMYKPTMDFTFEQIGTNTSVNLTNVTTQITNFFTSLQSGQTNKLCNYFSDCISPSTNAVAVEFYDITSHLDGSAAGPPIGINHFTWSPGGSSAASLPEEITAILSYRSDYGSDPEYAPGARPRATHRGRILLGPLSQFGLTHDSTTYASKLSATFVADINAAWASFTFNGTGSDVNAWVQWSRKEHRVLPITEAAIDPLFGVDRRRGQYRPDLTWLAT